MSIEEILKQIEELNLEDKNFNYIYRNLNEKDILEIRNHIDKSSINFNKEKLENGLFASKKICYKKVVIDFSITTMDEFFQEILNQCNIETKVNDFKYKNYLAFLKILAREQIGVHLHLFNVHVLSEYEQLHLKNIYLINTQNLITHTYFEQDNFYSNYFTENGQILDYRENIQVLKKTNNQYILKKDDIYE